MVVIKKRNGRSVNFPRAQVSYGAGKIYVKRQGRVVGRFSRANGWYKKKAWGSRRSYTGRTRYPRRM